MNIPKSHRSLLAQFRCGILPIRIETGRYMRNQYPIFYVIYVHKIMLKTNITSYYSSLRTDFFNNVGYVSSPLMSDLDCIKFLLTNFPRQTAKFINSAYMYRQSLLYRKR